MYSLQDSIDHQKMKSAQAGPLRLAVDRIPVNATYDKRIAHKARKLGHYKDHELDILVGDPVFTCLKQPSDSEMFVFSNYKATLTGCLVEAGPAANNIPELLCDNIRFVGFSETEIKCAVMNRTDIHVSVNTGGSLTVLCGEKDGIRTNERVCIDFDNNPESHECTGKMLVRSYKTAKADRPDKKPMSIGKCLRGGRFQEHIRILLRPSHIGL
jgi:hypothetical protein